MSGEECTAGDALLSVHQARQRILARVTPVTGRERLDLRAALGRVLATEVRSNIDVPPGDNSAMDGYAVRSADLPAQGTATVALVGTALAGVPFTGAVERGQCVRITTGALLPAGTDTVVAQERVRVDDQAVEIGPGHRSGENVRRAGEDIARGKPLLAAGTRLLPAELGLLAAIGLAEVQVYRRVRVAFFSTGDELRGLGQELEPGQIYDSNRYTLYGMLRRLDAEIVDLGVVRDRRDSVRHALQEAAADADVVLTSGGVSVGAADFVTQTLAELGEIDFWRIAMKPGKPLALGRIGAAVFFGLPGNPVSTMATFYQFVQPALRCMAGEPPRPPLVCRAVTLAPLRTEPGRLEYQRGILQTGDDGQLQVRSTGMQDSHVLTSMSRANCFIILPADCDGVEAGGVVEVQPFAGLI